MTKDAVKWAILTLLVLCCMGITYYCHFIIRAEVVFTHVFYVPVVLSTFWFARKGILVSFFVSGWILASHGFSDFGTPHIHDFLRSVALISIALVVAMLREQSLRLEEAQRQFIDELEAAYKKLKETQAKLIQAGKMAAMGTLGAGIAHQLNQPLAGIRGFAQAILMQIDETNPFYEDLKIIEEQTGHMRDIVLNISGFARRSGFKKEPVDINEPVDKALELLSEQLRVRGIKLVKSLAPDSPMVNANFNQMQQVFINFIVNAREALDALPDDARKELSISTRMRDGKTGESWIEIKFSDTGPGMQDEIKDRIYEPFFTTKVADSTGLGLYLNYVIIQDHGGYIESVLEEGKGASFIVKLPPLGSNQPLNPPLRGTKGGVNEQ